LRAPRKQPSYRPAEQADELALIFRVFTQPMPIVDITPVHSWPARLAANFPNSMR
jgi:hypothetical protein